MVLEPNEREIQPVQTWVNGQMKTLQLIRIDRYAGYDFNMSPGHAHYCLCSYSVKDQNDENGVYTHYLKPTIVDGNIELPWSLVETWGEDDTPIFEYVAQQLNLILE